MTQAPAPVLFSGHVCLFSASQLVVGSAQVPFFCDIAGSGVPALTWRKRK